MRNFLIIFFALLLAFAGYAYHQNPAGCKKIVTDVTTLLVSLSPVATHSDATPQPPVVPAPPAPTAQSVPVASAPTPVAAVTPPPTPAPPPVKAWAPPDVMPAQPNWTWQTSDGQTYQNVVVTKIEPETVTITHSMGVAHISMSLLPPDIQKQLNYDPVAAAAAHAESEREAAHPFYTMATRTDAQTVASQMHWPLAWVSSAKTDITAPLEAQNDEIELTQMALDHLKDKSIIIFIDANNEMPLTPAIVHHQFSAFDDGVLPGGANYLVPKVVFSNPDASKIFGRVSYTQMKASGALAIDEVFATIPADSDAQAPANGPSASTLAPASSLPAATPAPAASTVAPATAAVPAASTPEANPAPNTVKAWTPPAVMPAQPNWTWVSDGQTYQNVVVTKIEADTVTINHSMGVAHIPIKLLPADIQKQLNYDPRAATSPSP
jgi:hypothetical protein